MPTYRYLLHDLRTNTHLGELPFTVQGGLPRPMRAAGTATLTLPLGDDKIRRRNPKAMTHPRRTVVYVDRDGALVWGGIIWKRRFLAATGTLELTVHTFESLPYHQHVTADRRWTNTDQLAIFRALWTDMSAPTGADIGVTWDTATSGVLRDHEVKRDDNYGEKLEALAARENGFDYRIDVAYDSIGTPRRYGRLGYPRLGREATRTGIELRYPGNITDYEWSEDGASSANRYTAIGQGEGSTQLRSVQADQGEIDAGYPLLAATSGAEYVDVSVQTTLDAHARAGLAARRGDQVIPSVTIRGDVEPILGAYVPGDSMRLVIDDERYFERGPGGAPGIDTYRRSTGLTIYPPQAGALESVRLEFGQEG